MTKKKSAFAGISAAVLSNKQTNASDYPELIFQRFNVIVCGNSTGKDPSAFNMINGKNREFYHGYYRKKPVRRGSDRRNNISAENNFFITVYVVVLLQPICFPRAAAMSFALESPFSHSTCITLNSESKSFINTTPISSI